VSDRLGIATGSCKRLLEAAVAERRRLSRAGVGGEPLKHLDRILRGLVLMAHDFDADGLPPAGASLAVEIGDALVAFGSGEAFDGEVTAVCVVDRENVVAMG